MGIWVKLGVAMSKKVPSISSGVAGPLGVLHLPRLWEKASLSAVDKLHDDYAAAGRGFDQMVLDGLGVGREAFLTFIGERRPTYPQLEAWLLDRLGGEADSSAIAAINAAVVEHQHTEDVREEILADCDIEAGEVVKDALTLNNLDDWAAFYREEISD